MNGQGHRVNSFSCLSLVCLAFVFVGCERKTTTVVRDEAKLKTLEYQREAIKRADQYQKETIDKLVEIEREKADFDRQSKLKQQEADAEARRLAQTNALKREDEEAKRKEEARIREAALKIQKEEVDTKAFEVLIRKLFMETEELKADVKRLPPEITRIEKDREIIFDVLKNLSVRVVTNSVALPSGGIVMREYEGTLTPDAYIKAISENPELQKVLSGYGDNYMVKTALRELLAEFESSYSRLKAEKNLLDKKSKAFADASKTTRAMIEDTNNDNSAKISKIKALINKEQQEMRKIEVWSYTQEKKQSLLREKQNEIRRLSSELDILQRFGNVNKIMTQQKKTTEIGVDGSYDVHAMTIKNTYDAACRKAVDGAKTVILNVVNDSHKQKTKELEDTQARLSAINFLLDAHKEGTLPLDRKRVFLDKLAERQTREDEKASSLLFD